MIPDSDRFKITPKFLEDDTSDKEAEIANYAEDTIEKNDEHSSITDEKKKELAVLNQILGRAPANESKKNKEKTGLT